MDEVTGTGYRQRQILACFDRTPRLPVGFLIRQLDTDPKIVDSSLRGLAARGLVRRVRYGVWERAEDAA